MVALLGPVRLGLDRAERTAVDILLDVGLVSGEDADAAFAEPDLPEWMVAARTPTGEQRRLSATG